MNNNTKKALAAAGVLAMLAFAFWYGGGAPELQGWQTGRADSSALESSASFSSSGASGSSLSPVAPPNHSEATPVQPDQSAPATSHPAPSVTEKQSQEDSETIASQPPNSPVNSPQIDLPPTSAEKQQLTCTFSIRCDAILDNWDWLDPNKAELVPTDGVILAAVQVPFEEGDTVFDLLQRQTQAADIHMEASFTPGYGSSYVEGIANLYEFDCGQQSGWIYLVNGVSPGYGSSQYSLSAGDVVEWTYTCNLAKDVSTGVSG